MSQSQHEAGALPTPPLEESLQGLQDQIEALSSRLSRERLRWRVQTGLAVVVVTGTLLLSPGARQAIAQQSGGLPALELRVKALEQQATQIVAQLTNEAAARQAGDTATLSSANGYTDQQVAEEAATRAAADTALASRATTLEARTQYMRVDGTTTLFIGTNVQIVSGSGATNGDPSYPFGGLGTVNGLGNLIVGYNENDRGYARTGSHNLVVGMGHGYTSYGGFLAGFYNQITGSYASVSGGLLNTAEGGSSSVSGGQRNIASGLMTSVSGGYGNTAERYNSSVSGGAFNRATGYISSVSGGQRNNAGGDYSSVSGGAGNFTGGNFSSILGGNGYILLTEYGTYPAGP